MNYKRGLCLTCYTRIQTHECEEFTDRLFLMEVENNRRIYFAPVGNQFNFGYHNNGHTPKVAILGITTSYSAYKNFSKKLKEFIDGGDDFDNAFRNACLLNIFNSEPPTLRRNLNKILDLAQVNKIIGTKKIVLDSIALEAYITNKADKETEKILDEVYFSQAIPCASCDNNNKSTEPKPKEIGDFQSSCIKTQIDFIDSLNGTVELLIIFGKAYDIINRRDNVLRNKFKRIVNIDHPASGRGWNALKLMSLPEKDFCREIDKKYYRDSQKQYRAMCKNCYDQIIQIKDCVKDVLSSHS